MNKQQGDSKVQQRNLDQEQKPLIKEEETEQIDKKDLEKRQASSLHILNKPSLSGFKYDEFPMTSIVLHLTFFIMLAIYKFAETNVGPMGIIITFFYIGIQIESLFGDIPNFFKIKPVLRDITPILKQWKEKSVDLTYDVISYHYQSSRVHGQKRRSKSFSSSDSVKLDYLTCEDVTEDCSEIFKKYNIFVIYSSIMFTYGNQKAEQEITNKIKTIKEEQQKQDKYVDDKINIQLKDIQNEVVDLVYAKSGSIFINKFFFWLTSLLLLTVPYRLYVNSQTAHLQYKIHKKIYV
ncbi:transmembrane protein, putative (macronuclear) [Tetrahymena thermophila SB210]|uniref:Transmembrane protein, putative n=1 Tax=Tetrahymena thermophila (strain SB210) TaxID=312017 RepID=I7M1S9_TETTS|nr:transmembrane protein, putative [Tetrahymena thermophila SB210]EAR97512.2 transmembrane protein, putative [Tetrahymena thermophila SB210]|eukprot:XP_001017757.2 transmembrane protein, putative [Tetrahymena thermophila SB210]